MEGREEERESGGERGREEERKRKRERGRNTRVSSVLPGPCYLSAVCHSAVCERLKEGLARGGRGMTSDLHIMLRSFSRLAGVK